MKKKNPFIYIFRRFNTLHITDRILFIFMLVLLLQSGISLFLNEAPVSDAVTLDVVIRTTSAAIFGYFISAGFRGEIEDTNLNSQNTIGFAKNIMPNDKPISKIGFLAETKTDVSLQNVNMKTDYKAATNKRIYQQITIVAIIGLFSLLMLIFARYCSSLTAESTANLSQLRDFVSGSVGFLIGHSNKEIN